MLCMKVNLMHNWIRFENYFMHVRMLMIVARYIHTVVLAAIMALLIMSMCLMHNWVLFKNCFMLMLM